MDARLEHVLPQVGERRVAVRVTPAALRRVREGHPWVFADSVRSISHDAAPGDLAVVFDDRRRFAAIGLWDPSGPIRVRVVQHNEPTTIDATFWAERLDRAERRREPLLRRPGLAAAGVPADQVATTGLRLVNGENDGFGGLIIDRYASVAVVKVYTDAWWPHLAEIVTGLGGQAGIDSVVLRVARRVHLPAGLRDGDLLATSSAWSPAATRPRGVELGRPGDPDVEFLENGLRFGADVAHGQKTGWFLDQRANRARVAAAADGADVLDMFSAGGGFSVHAAAGGAASVLSVDAARPAIVAATANFERNQHIDAVRSCRHRTIVGDAFDTLEQLDGAGARFDIAVVDPPAFARRADHVGRAMRAYRTLAVRALRLLRPGGLLVQASCSARIGIDDLADVVASAAALDRVPAPVLEWSSGHDIDHPVTFVEGAYLCAGGWRTG